MSDLIGAGRWVCLYVDPFPLCDELGFKWRDKHSLQTFRFVGTNLRLDSLLNRLTPIKFFLRLLGCFPIIVNISFPRVSLSYVPLAFVVTVTETEDTDDQ